MWRPRGGRRPPSSKAKGHGVVSGDWSGRDDGTRRTKRVGESPSVASSVTSSTSARAARLTLGGFTCRSTCAYDSISPQPTFQRLYNYRTRSLSTLPTLISSPSFFPSLLSSPPSLTSSAPSAPSTSTPANRDSLAGSLHLRPPTPIGVPSVWSGMSSSRSRLLLPRRRGGYVCACGGAHGVEALWGWLRRPGMGSSWMGRLGSVWCQLVVLNEARSRSCLSWLSV